MFNYLNDNTAASDNFSGLAVFVDLAKSRPLTELLVVVNLKLKEKYF